MCVFSFSSSHSVNMMKSGRAFSTDARESRSMRVPVESAMYDQR